MRRYRHLSVTLAGAIILAAGMLVVAPVGTAADVGPNGLLAYWSWDDDLFYDIYTIDPADPAAEPIRLTTDGQYNNNPDWSPDGTRIVYDG